MGNGQGGTSGRVKGEDDEGRNMSKVLYSCVKIGQ
jgi:hypothetical protein